MKIIYILGLEHSGTTLTDQLLSGATGVVGLGEVAHFFSRAHMSKYHDKWGHYPDAYLCSCGQSLESCEFWGKLKSDSGLVSTASVGEQYSNLVSAAQQLYGNDVVIVDSSKSIWGLENWLGVLDQCGLTKTSVHVVLSIKDVRSFVASMVRKAGGDYSFINHCRSFNYWCGANTEFFNFLSRSNLPYELSLYEDLCVDTNQVLHRISQEAINADSLTTSINHADSHIMIGNKSFIMRNRDKIRYDDAWRSSIAINTIYRFHRRARKMNRFIYADASINVLN